MEIQEGGVKGLAVWSGGGSFKKALMEDWREKMRGYLLRI